jgi:type IV pilus assembly protein PilE
MKIYSFVNTQKGFTLIELMVVVVVVAILAAIAVPSYQYYIRRAHLAQAQQEMLKLAEQLERHKAKNFSYKGFNAAYLYTDKAGTLSTNFNSSDQELKLPIDSANPSYKVSIIGFYSTNNYIKDEDGKITGFTGFKVKTDKLNKVIDFDQATQADMFAIGSNWAIKAESLTLDNYALLLNSQGMKCMNKKDYTKVTYLTCGSESEGGVSW